MILAAAQFNHVATMISAYEDTPYVTTPIFPIIGADCGADTFVPVVGISSMNGKIWMFLPDKSRHDITSTSLFTSNPDTIAMIETQEWTDSINSALASLGKPVVSVVPGSRVSLLPKHNGIRLVGSSLMIDNIAGSGTVQLFTAAGRMARSFQVRKSAAIDLANLTAGAYIIRVASTAGVTSTRIVLDR